MNEVVAYSTLAMTVGLAVGRPQLGRDAFRFSPGSAALLGVTILLAAGLLTPRMLLEAARVQWRPLLALTAIMVMTGVVQEVGAFERLASKIEHRARSATAVRTFTIVFALAVVTPSLLNNDAAILILTPLVVALARRLYPRNPQLVMVFAFAVFLAPGVAPFIVSNPMNMIVAEFAGLGFNSYAAVMLPLSLVGALLTYGVLRFAFRRALAEAVPAELPPTTIHPHEGEPAAVRLMLGVFCAYPIVAWCGGPTWCVAVAGALAALAISRHHGIASVKRVAARHVSLDILVFLWGIFLVVQGLRSVGVVDGLAAAYRSAPAGGTHIATIGVLSALGSAVIDNHPMSILNMLAIDQSHGAKPLLAALVGGDIGPRLLPIGSLAGLLWMDLLRRQGVEIGIGRFVRLGTIVLLPTLAVSLLLLWLM